MEFRNFREMLVPDVLESQEQETCRCQSVSRCCCGWAPSFSGTGFP